MKFYDMSSRQFAYKNTVHHRFFFYFSIRFQGNRIFKSSTILHTSDDVTSFYVWRMRCTSSNTISNFTASVAEIVEQKKT